MKQFLTILFLSIFMLAQYGRLISYAYCKWEYRQILNCDCEKILVGDDHQNAELAKVNISPKWEEPWRQTYGMALRELTLLLIEERRLG